MKALLSAAAVCVSAEFFLITSQRSPTVVRQREGRARGSEVEEVRRGGAEGGRQERRNVDRNREAELRGASRGSEGGNGAEAKRRGSPEIFRWASVCHVDCHFGSAETGRTPRSRVAL